MGYAHGRSRKDFGNDGGVQFPQEVEERHHHSQDYETEGSHRQDTSEQESSAQENEGTKEKDKRKVGMEEQDTKDNDGKEGNPFIKTFEGKKYYWCLHHNNGTGMWTLHYPNNCEANKATTSPSTNANIAAFSTMDSDSERE